MSRKIMTILLSIICLIAMSIPASAETTHLAPEIYLDYARGIREGVYRWFASEDGSYYYLASANADGTPLSETSVTYFSPEVSFEKTLLTGVYTASEITNTEYQTMVVYVPAAYGSLNEDGTLTIDAGASVNGYTPATAPIIFENSNGGWNSGTTGECNAEYMAEGYIYVTCGSRSRNAMDGDVHTGKAPMAVVDLKAGVMALRANAAMLPGNMDAIISIGTSGGGQMSSILGASGDMSEYYPYLYEIGAVGVSRDGDSYTSAYQDSIYAAQCFCPIADIANADLAYAWMRYDSTTDETGDQTASAGNYSFTPFQLKLQELEAEAFVEYVNSLSLTDAEGNALTLTDMRSGNYYELVLEEISNAINAYAENNTWPLTESARGGMGGGMRGGMGGGMQGGPDGYADQKQDEATTYETMDDYIAAKYTDVDSWLQKDAEGRYVVTDMAGFINGTGLVRNKDIPGFDALNLSAENNAFGASETDATHYSASVAKVMQANYDALSELASDEEKAQMDAYIENAMTDSGAVLIEEQTYLMNATRILLDTAEGKVAANPAKFFRTRNGTADQHTSFTIAMNICLTAEMAGMDADYALVWNMQHGSEEGTTTGTFIDWVNSIPEDKAARAALFIGHADADAVTSASVRPSVDDVSVWIK